MSNQRNADFTPTPDQIKAHRYELGLSQRDYGQLIGVSGFTIGAWEANKHTPSAKHSAAIRSIMSGEPHNPQTVIIDWQALVGVHQGIKGVSLRHLVNLGLYATYQRASEALERDPELFSPSLKSITITNTGGRPGADYIITDLTAVQMFCARARTEMGARILEVILDHHNELQAMLAGDADAQARHEQAKTPQPSDPLDALAAMIEQMRQQRDRQQQLEREVETTKQTMQLTTDLMTDTTQRLAAVETALNTTPIAGHVSAYQIAQRGGYLSAKGRPHESAVHALAFELGLEEEGESYEVMSEINGHLCPTRRYTPNGAAMLLNELRRLSKQTKAPFFNVKSGSKTYTVYRAQ